MKTLLPVYLILCLLTPVAGIARKTDSIPGRVEVKQDPKVDILVAKHIQINQNRKGIDGFRIQVFSDSGNSSKSSAQGVLDGFAAKYPAVGAYLQFKSPNYKVRVGDFRSRLEAQRFLNEVLVDYPNAFIVTDLISLPSIEN